MKSWPHSILLQNSHIHTLLPVFFILTEKLGKEPGNEANFSYCYCGYLPVSLAKQKQEGTAVSVEGGDDEGGTSGGGGVGGQMDSDSMVHLLFFFRVLVLMYNKGQSQS